eukprot:4875901-Pyramimonas_sp.AAC.1
MSYSLRVLWTKEAMKLDTFCILSTAWSCLTRCSSLRSAPAGHPPSRRGPRKGWSTGEMPRAGQLGGPASRGRPSN